MKKHSKVRPTNPSLGESDGYYFLVAVIAASVLSALATMVGLGLAMVT